MGLTRHRVVRLRKWEANDVTPATHHAGDFRELSLATSSPCSRDPARSLAIDVVRQDAADSGLASPGAGSEKK